MHARGGSSSSSRSGPHYVTSQMLRKNNKQQNNNNNRSVGGRTQDPTRPDFLNHWPLCTSTTAHTHTHTHTGCRACVHARARTAPGGRQPDEGAGRRIPARWRGWRGRGEERRRRRGGGQVLNSAHIDRHHMHVQTHTHTLSGRHLPVVQTGLSRPDSAQGSRSPWCSRYVRDSRWKLPQRPSTERCRAARMNTHKHSSKIK